MNVDTILVPTDFSQDAQEAIRTAAELARLFDARVVLLHAYYVDIPIATPMVGGYSLPAGFYEALRSRGRGAGRRSGGEAVRDGDRTPAVSRCPQPAATAIVAEAERLPADLIVMGTRGLTGLKHVGAGKRRRARRAHGSLPRSHREGQSLNRHPRRIQRRRNVMNESSPSNIAPWDPFSDLEIFARRPRFGGLPALRSLLGEPPSVLVARAGHHRE